MNEITKIHLGRLSFVIAVDAHHALQAYLRAIKKHMGDSDDAVEEVELRMAELLTERGITGDKVVLIKDVDYLKEQLGAPGDFGDEQSEEATNEATNPKRLFRDTKHGMIAGVAAGLAAYFGVKPIVVRAVFVLAALTVVGGIFNLSWIGGFWLTVLLYIVLWVVIPGANTGSERLQMRGKPVTVDAIKETVEEAVERADVKGATARVQQVVSKVAQMILKFLQYLIGLSLTLAGIGALLGLTMLGVYWALNHDLLPAHIFPVGTSEVLLVCLGFVVLAAVAFFFLITGVAVLRRKWPLPSWALGAVVAIFLVSLAVGGALAADAVPNVQERYEAAKNTYVQTVPEFNKLRVVGNFESSVRYEESATNAVVIKYWGDASFPHSLADVKDQLLTVDAHKINDSLRCQKVCLFRPPILEVVIRGPKLQEVTAELKGSRLDLPNVSNQTIKVHVIDGTVHFDDFAADLLQAKLVGDEDWTLTFAGGYKGSSTSPQDMLLFKVRPVVFDTPLTEQVADIVAEKNIELTFDGQCGTMASLETGKYIHLNRSFEKLTINGTVVGSAQDQLRLFDKPGMSPFKCVDVNAPGDAVNNS